MTREEAIFCEKSYIGETNCIDCKYCGTETCQSRESHRMAIKALEQEPCEDAVSRKAVFEAIDDCSSDGLKGIFCSYHDGEKFKEYIKELPFAAPQPKTGHWIEEFNDLEGEVRFICSSCGKYQLFGTDYCYNCGAKIVDPQESENKE